MKINQSITLLAAFLLLSIASCSAPKLYKQGLQKIEKAILKDPSLSVPKDTITIVEHDTIRGVDGKDSIIIRKETIQLPCDFDQEAFIQSIEEKSGRELRFERRNAKDLLKHTEKMYALETKRLNDSLVFQKKLNRELTKRLNNQNSTDVKIAKQETKQKNGDWFSRFKKWIFVYFIGIGTGIGLFYSYKKYKY